MPFRSKRQQRLFFATMPDTAKEWASKTDFSKLPEKVKKKKSKSKKKDKNDCGEKALQFATKFEKHVKASLLPDGSSFFTASFPLPEDHWLYSDDDSKIYNSKNKLQNAARSAIKATTSNGKITDFDPDAMVQNFLLAMK